jgi:hypothetical protein
MTRAWALAVIWAMTLTATVLLGIVDYLGHQYLLGPLGHHQHLLAAPIIGGVLFCLSALLRSYKILRN